MLPLVLDQHGIIQSRTTAASRFVDSSFPDLRDVDANRTTPAMRLSARLMGRILTDTIAQCCLQYLPTCC
jgi:hypothetical protein